MVVACGGFLMTASIFSVKYKSRLLSEREDVGRQAGSLREEEGE